ncbi:MAG: PQQ-dependent sugar dehydrogenase [Dokdonella sp.]
MRAIRTAALVALTLASAGVSAQAIPGLSVVPVGSFTEPVAVRAPNDGSGRIFVVQKNGNIRVVKNGATLATPFLTLPVSTSSEQGLLGLAFHPNFGKAGLSNNTEFYVAYTRPGADPRLGSQPDQAIARYTVPTLDADVATPTGTLVMRVPDLAGNHNGGDLHFGPDGYLYYSSGDGGPQNNPHGFAECLWKKTNDNNPSNCGVGAPTYYLLGKMVRIDVDNRGGAATAEMCGSNGISPAQYSIPASNPHVATSSTCDEIFAHGFRNPFRFSFDRGTGDLVIGDVGQNLYEEVTVQAAGTGGGDHGWSRCEGLHFFNAAGTGTVCPSTTGTISPVLEYTHSAGRCSITGGFVYRGPSSRLNGTYFYGDACAGGLYYATAGAPGALWAPSVLNSTLAVGSTWGYGEDEAGNVYIAQAGGTVLRIVSDFIFDNGFD